MSPARTPAAPHRCAISLGLCLAACALALSLSGPPALAASTLGPCRHDATGAFVLGLVKQQLVEFGGYAADSIQVVTDSATCAAGVAAYNRDQAPDRQVSDAYIMRRGRDGYVLVSPKFLDSQVYFSASWEQAVVLEGI